MGGYSGDEDKKLFEAKDIMCLVSYDSAFSNLMANHEARVLLPAR